MAIPEQPRLLVVDDSTVVRHILVLMLRQMPPFAQAEIDQAGNGAIALERLKESRYDMVISDVRMPYVDGVEMVRRVRDDMQDATTPIFLVSTLGSDDDVRRGLEAGATAYILKPLSPHVIRKAIEEYLERGAVARRPRE